MPPGYEVAVVTVVTVVAVVAAAGVVVAAAGVTQEAAEGCRPFRLLSAGRGYRVAPVLPPYVAAYSSSIT